MNHHMLLAQAKVMKLCHKMLPDAKIGPAPNITAIYAKTCKPEDVIAANNWETLRCWLYLDVAVWGRYNALAWSYLCGRGCQPDFEPGDEETLAGMQAGLHFHELLCNSHRVQEHEPR